MRPSESSKSPLRCFLGVRERTLLMPEKPINQHVIAAAARAVVVTEDALAIGVVVDVLDHDLLARSRIAEDEYVHPAYFTINAATARLPF